MKYIDADKIRSEIERRKNTAETMRERGAYIGLLDYLDTLPEQPVEGLEEEIDRLWESFSEEMSGPHNLFDMYRRLARHFAEWGERHTKQLSDE